MSTDFVTKIAITGFVRQITTMRLFIEGDLSVQPTECRYCRYPATKGGYHGNHFLASIGLCGI